MAYLANTMCLSFLLWGAGTLIFCEGFNDTILFRQYITLLLLYTRLHCVVLLSTGVSLSAPTTVTIISALNVYVTNRGRKQTEDTMVKQQLQSELHLQ